MKIRFEWDPVKAASNRRKHGISFPVAARIFADPLRITAPDRVAEGELRWRTLGMTDELLLLVVAHTVRDAADGAEVIRIVSARKAERSERRRYEEENGEA